MHFSGALDATMSIDNRIFTGAGRASIVNDVSSLPANLEAAGKGAVRGAVNL